MQKLFFWLRLPVFLLGLVLVFVTERYLGGEAYAVALRSAALGLCALSVVMTFALSMIAARKGYGAEARAWRLVVLWQVGLLVSIGLYHAYQASLGTAVAPETPQGKALLGAWLVTMVVAIAAGIGLEWAQRDNGRGAYAEPQRVARSGGAWLMIGMLLSILGALNYVGEKRNVTRDWSYLKVTTPSDSTKTMLKGLTKDLTVAAFFPPGNDVRVLVSQYLDALGQAEGRVKVAYYDKDMHPTQAEEYRVSRNGQIVFDVDGKRSRIDTGTTLAKARKTLRNFDGEFQKSFLEITASKKTIYFTRGHGEASWIGDAADDPLRSLSELEGYLRRQNYVVKLFGIGEGSATAVPDDAAAVVVVGPTQPFQQEEADALEAYLAKGGKLLVFFDIGKGTTDQPIIAPATDPLRALVAKAGIAFEDAPLANDKNYVAMTRSPADAWFIFSNVFTSHESVMSLARNDERVAILVFQGGRFTVTPETDGWRTFETVRSLSDTFVDQNRDFKFDEATEKRDSYVLGAVAESKAKPEGGGTGGRILAFADASVLADGLLRNPANALFFVDGLRWAVGEVDRGGGPSASEEDVRIRHTRKEDVMWFHGTVVIVPLLVLGAGFLATRRRRSDARGPGGGGGQSAQEKSDAA